MDRLSYILKVADPTTNKVFICNRKLSGNKMPFEKNNIKNIKLLYYDKVA